MTFENVNKTGGGFTSLAKLPQGEPIVGYLVEIIKNEKYPNASNLVFQMADGSSKTVGASGDLKYFIMDAKRADHTRDITLNVMTKLTNTGSRPTKAGARTTTFLLAQDKSDVLAGKKAVSFKSSVNGAATNEAAVVAAGSNEAKAATKSKAEALMAELEGNKQAKKVNG